MTEQEQNLLDAAKEILLDFDRYGEVLQLGDNGEYGTKSAIGRLNTAVCQYEDGKRESCDDCPYRDDNGVCQSWIGCLNEGVTDESEELK